MSARAALLGYGSGDPFWSNVVFLGVNDSAANNSTSFVDQSTAAHSITTVGTAKYDTAHAPTGMSSSLKLDGSGRLTVSASSDFAYGTGAFTLEMMLYYNVNSGDKTPYDQRSGSDAQSMLFQSNGTILFTFFAAAQGMTVTIPATGAWHHLALTRSGNSWRAFLDGTQFGTTVTNNGNYSTSDPLTIGNDWTLVSAFNGWMASIRITKGVARYTANFTPPTLPFPNH